jgi:hypothetical protein
MTKSQVFDVRDFCSTCDCKSLIVKQVKSQCLKLWIQRHGMSGYAQLYITLHQFIMKYILYGNYLVWRIEKPVN